LTTALTGETDLISLSTVFDLVALSTGFTSATFGVVFSFFTEGALLGCSLIGFLGDSFLADLLSALT